MILLGFTEFVAWINKQSYMLLQTAYGDFPPVQPVVVRWELFNYLITDCQPHPHSIYVVQDIFLHIFSYCYFFYVLTDSVISVAVTVNLNKNAVKPWQVNFMADLWLSSAFVMYSKQSWELKYKSLLKAEQWL